MLVLEISYRGFDWIFYVTRTKMCRYFLVVAILCALLILCAHYSDLYAHQEYLCVLLFCVRSLLDWARLFVSALCFYSLIRLVVVISSFRFAQLRC